MAGVRDLPTAGVTVLLSFLLAVLLAAVLQLESAAVRASPFLTVVAGAACSLVFLLVLVLCGSLHAIMSSDAVSSGYFEISVAALAMLVLAATIHPVCITVGTVGSAFLLWEMNRVAHVLYFESESVASAGNQKRK
ncbi:hypothetical protein FVE85_5807 [Porphyridium purpureum]|uniref:Uncharacterized protein n=1 Tax=Porphyridium purpureum TaxID=35688 RepID=A0A5J4Z4Y1_PORPP|nr:hypothetical protein FVE85_5807 [Porphyridium purpureum]|eukprot:POR2221..scf295_1